MTENKSIIERHHIKVNSAEFQIGAYFIDNPEVLIGKKDIALRAGLVEPYSKDSIVELMNRTRQVVSVTMRQPGSIFTFRSEGGYAYYPVIPDDKIIAPVGLRPIPEWATEHPLLRGLFESIRFATIIPSKPIVKLAITRQAYDYLLLLSRAFSMKGGVYLYEAMDELGISSDNHIAVLDKYLQRDLGRITNGMWTVVHEGPELYDKSLNGISYLTTTLSHETASSEGLLGAL